MKTAKLRRKDVTSSDIISHLPDDLLLRILSSIPISDAMNTTLLSKRWKSLWKMMPTLEYDQSSCANVGSLGFHKFCERSLQLHEAPLLKTLTLQLGQHSEDLKFLFSLQDTFLQKLVVLKLHQITHYLADSPTSTVSLQSLKSLHLTRVRFRGGESLCRLISSCPVLEDLFLDSVTSSFYAPSLFTILVPSLQRLEIKDNPSTVRSYRRQYHSRFKITTPSLKYLSIKAFKGSFIFYEDMPNLVEARLGVSPYQAYVFLRFLTSVEFLSINIRPKEILLLAEKISHRLLHLKLHIFGKYTRNLLLCLLKHAPKLQFLELQEIQKIRRPTARVRKFNDPLPSVCSVPECVSFHLKTFQWLLYRGREEDKQSVLYILQNARCLKTAVISLSSCSPRRGEELLMIKELESMPKVSTSCKLVVRHW
ncbi:hypothetical protein N665_0197s0014 [Sinapis alba]|nr:hypothetical protein N665_0197s0014 [Sinapis alba]